MKRHPQLRFLSQDHHHTLAMCLRILRAPKENHQTEIEAHYVGLMAHFQAEEQQFNELWQLLQSPDLQTRFEQEHAKLRLMYREPRYNDEQWNIEFATLLRDHARFEERELFPAIEALLPTS